MNCEMCGAKDQLFKTEIEGTEMNLCKNCSKFGKVISAVRIPPKPKKSARHEEEKIEIMQRTPQEITEEIIENYPELISTKRQKLNLKQKELAIKMAEKESIIQKVEAGQFKPSIPLARKFERALGIKLIEEHIEEHKQAFRAKSEKMTIGDFMYIKKSKSE
jgi:putative transcription factor